MAFLFGLSGCDPSREVVAVPEDRPTRRRTLRRPRVSTMCTRCAGIGLVRGYGGPNMTTYLCGDCRGSGRDE